jgi:putative protease
LGNELVVEVGEPLAEGDGVGFEPPAGARGAGTGISVGAVRTLGTRAGLTRQALAARAHRAGGLAGGPHVARGAPRARAGELRRAFAPRAGAGRASTCACSAAPGGPFKAVFRSGDDEVTVRSEVPLVAASKRALDVAQIRDQLGRLGETPFALAEVDAAGLAPGLFLPVSELNRLRQTAADELSLRRDWAREADLGERVVRIAAAVAAVPGAAPADPPTADDATYSVPVDPDGFGPPAFVVIGEDAGLCAGALATSRASTRSRAAQPRSRCARLCTISTTRAPRLRPARPRLCSIRSSVTRRRRSPRALRSPTTAGAGCGARLRRPTTRSPARSAGAREVLALELPLLSAPRHRRRVRALGRDVIADYAVNAFTQHTAADALPAGRVGDTSLSVELTADE